ncbi:uncharacterized protein LOC109062712 isoform X1 [Tachysurus ichikawai]
MNFVKQLESAQPTEVRTLVLRGLPVLLGDDDGGLIRAHRSSAPNSLHLNSSIGIILKNALKPKVQSLANQLFC